MKSLVSIAISFLFLFQGIVSNVDICEQAEKISDFISHYQEHKQIEGYSLIKYVYEDYINNSANSDDHHQDSEHDHTPIHSSHQCCQHFVILTRYETVNLNSVFSEEQTQFNHYTSNFHSRFLESLFQPPQV